MFYSNLQDLCLWMAALAAIFHLFVMDLYFVTFLQ